MNFEYIDFNNGALLDTPGLFAVPPEQTQRGEDFWHPTVLDVGAKVLSNGDVDFGVYAPDAKTVTMVGLPEANAPCQRHEDGTWHYLLKWDAAFCGPKSFSFSIDGMTIVSPHCPVFYTRNHLINYVEIPDPNADFIYMRDVPHGSLVNDYYFSKTLNKYQRVISYLPPGYEKGGTYPVLYLQHGGWENETSWPYNGKVPHIMDNLIADGLAEPFIVVMGNGMIHFPDADRRKSHELFSENMTESLIPFIDGRYRTKADKWHRAIGGFSFGSEQSCFTGLNHPELFSHIGLLSGFMRMIGSEFEHDTTFETNFHLKPLLNREQFEADYKLFYRAIGTSDFKYEAAFVPDNKICAENGFDKYKNYRHLEIEGYQHDWAALRILFHDFAQYLFKD
ncbi:MAG: hypothetical protein HUJ75_02735 [Parasporobacterium sp.]|nr:hypothetical protein [Parasporobacterium sp.]